MCYVCVGAYRGQKRPLEWELHVAANVHVSAKFSASTVSALGY